MRPLKYSIVVYCIGWKYEPSAFVAGGRRLFPPQKMHPPKSFNSQLYSSAIVNYKYIGTKVYDCSRLSIKLIQNENLAHLGELISERPGWWEGLSFKLIQTRSLHHH